MKKILLPFVILLTFLPGGLVAAQDTITLPISSVANLAQYQGCSNFEECPGYRDALIDALRGLLEQLLAAKLAEAGAGDPVAVDYSDFKDATHQILSSGNLAGESVGAVPDITRDIWNDFKKIAPEEYVTDYMSYVRVYHDEDDFFAAYVETDENNDHEKWGLGVNLANIRGEDDQQKRNLIETLVHEFAHILTLNVDQVDNSVSERRCGTYYSNGCSYNNSYIDEYVDEFWTRADFRHVNKIIRESNEDLKDDLADDYFDDNPNDFVSPYATWHPDEDIAESFTHFVLASKPGSDVRKVDEKTLFFYQYPELVSMRSQIRVNYQELFNF